MSLLSLLSLFRLSPVQQPTFPQIRLVDLFKALQYFLFHPNQSISPYGGSKVLASSPTSLLCAASQPHSSLRQPNPSHSGPCLEPSLISPSPLSPFKSLLKCQLPECPAWSRSPLFQALIITCNTMCLCSISPRQNGSAIRTVRVWKTATPLPTPRLAQAWHITGPPQ